MTVTQLKTTFKELLKIAVESVVEKNLTFYDSTSWVYSIWNTLALVRLVYKKDSKFWEPISRTPFLKTNVPNWCKRSSLRQADRGSRNPVRPNHGLIIKRKKGWFQKRKKKWCCVGGGVKLNNLAFITELLSGGQTPHTVSIVNKTERRFFSFFI